MLGSICSLKLVVQDEYFALLVFFFIVSWFLNQNFLVLGQLEGEKYCLLGNYYVLRYCALCTCHSLIDSQGIAIYYLHFKDKK